MNQSPLIRQAQPRLSPETVNRVRSLHIAGATPARPGRDRLRWLPWVAGITLFTICLWGWL